MLVYECYPSNVISYPSLLSCVALPPVLWCPSLLSCAALPTCPELPLPPVLCCPSHLSCAAPSHPSCAVPSICPAPDVVLCAHALWYHMWTSSLLSGDSIKTLWTTLWNCAACTWEVSLKESHSYLKFKHGPELLSTVNHFISDHFKACV